VEFAETHLALESDIAVLTQTRLFLESHEWRVPSSKRLVTHGSSSFSLTLFVDQEIKIFIRAVYYLLNSIAR
jgi:hypothetical protein